MTAAKQPKRFKATLYEGHSDCAVVVPFDPAVVWDAEPRRIGYRSYRGYPVQGTVAGQAFEGWVWYYFHEWRLVIPDAVLAKARAGPGDEVRVALRPHSKPDAVDPYKPSPRRRSTR